MTELKSNSEQLEVPITEEVEIPNMYVSVVVISPPATITVGDEEKVSGELPSLKSATPATPSTPKKNPAN
ncbi:MAG: hypothetical protein U0401_30095 [Anaerolineae bacterium]